MTAHALLGASKAHRWMRCPGSIALEAELPDISSPHAEEGTRAHEMASAILEKQSFSTDDSAMLEAVITYTDYVRREAEGHHLLVEQRVDYSDVIGVGNSFGTSDAIILAGDTIKIIDLKFGMGVRVDATENEQLMLYALGALETFGVTGHYTKAKLVIVQPRLDHISEWEVSIEELQSFGEDARWHAQLALDIYEGRVETVLRPSAAACKFCKAKANCPALLAHVQDSVGADFENLDEDEIKTSPMGMGSNSLGVALAAVPLIEDWCKAVRAKAESELLAGRPVNGFKLVQGRNGARKWANEGEAEATLKRMKLKVEEMYDLKLITPPMAEKLAKAGTIGPKQWPSLQGLIVQKAGPPSVAPETDKRPAWSPADDFQNLDEEK
jgi:hypothetical protein